MRIRIRHCYIRCPDRTFGVGGGIDVRQGVVSVTFHRSAVKQPMNAPHVIPKIDNPMTCAAFPAELDDCPSAKESDNPLLFFIHPPIVLRRAGGMGAEMAAHEKTARRRLSAAEKLVV